MKKLLILIVIVLSVSSCMAQPVVNRAGPANTVQDGRWKALYNSFQPIYDDTTTANVQKGVDSAGAIIQTRSPRAMWRRERFPTKHWVMLLDAESTTQTVTNVTIINQIDSSITIEFCTGLDACDTITYVTNVTNATSVSFLTDSSIRVCSVDTVSGGQVQICDTIITGKKGINYIFQNGIAPVAGSGGAIIEHGAGSLLHNTTLNTDYYKYNIFGTPVYDYTLNIKQGQTFPDGTGLASFWSAGNRVAGQPDVGNTVRLGINYTGQNYPSLSTGYFGNSTIGYFLNVNGTGNGSYGLRADNPSSKVGGIIFETLSSSTIGLSLFAAPAPGASTYWNMQPNTGEGYKNINLHTNRDIELLGKTYLNNARLEMDYGANVASANNLTLGTDGNSFLITGTTQINAITTANWQNGSVVYLKIQGALTIKHNTAGGAGTAPILLAGATDFVTTGGDVLALNYNGSAWDEVGRKASASGGGGTGTVTSVNASISGALSVSGGPITSNGTLAFSWTGNNTQMVRGDGSLASIPAGTVTSVGLSMPSAFSVANSPVTSSGTLTVTGVGTTSQLIDGTGALQTISIGANPSATIGLSATNGAATTFMRSDAAPALSQAITPTWTGVHTFDNNLLMLTSRFQMSKGADVAAANDLTLGADGNLFSITGNTQINAITTANWQAGSEIAFIFTGTPTLKNNTAGGAGTATMLLAGRVDYTAGAGDYIAFRYDGTNWYETQRKLAATGGTYTFTNGLTESPAGTVKLGGTLSATTTLIGGANDLVATFNSVGSGNGLSITSNSTAAASSTQRLVNIDLSGANSNSGQDTRALYVSNTHTGASSTNYAGYFNVSGGTTNRAIYAQTTGGAAIEAQATSSGATGIIATATGSGGTGLLATSSNSASSIAISGNSTNGIPGQFTKSTASTNTVANVIRIQRSLSSGTAGVGLGGDVAFYTQVTSGATSQSAAIASTWTDLTASTEDGDLRIYTTLDGVSAVRFKINAGGALVHTTDADVGSGATSHTLSATSAYFQIYNGTGTGTYALPAVSGNTGMILVFKNTNSGSQVIDSNAGGNDIYTTTAVNTLTLTTGQSAIFINTGVYWAQVN